MTNNLNKKIAHNSIAQFIGKVFSIVLGLFTVALITRYLGKNGFGQYTTIMTFLQFFAIFVDMGLTLTAAQMISLPGCDEKKIMGNIFSLRIISGIVFLSLAPITALFFPYPDIIKIGIALAAISFFFTSIFQVILAVFQKHLSTYKAAIADTFCRLLLLVFTIIAIKLNQGLYGIIIAIILSNLCQVIIYLLLAKKYVNIKWQIDFSVWQKIWETTWPIFITIVFNLIYFKADTLFLSIFKSFSEVGIYGAAYKVLEVVITIPFIICGLVLPLLTKFWANKDKENFHSIIQQGFNILIILSIPMIIGTIILAKPLMIAVSGPEFAASGFVLQILIFATAIIFINSIFSHAIISINKQKAIIPAYLLTAIFSIFAYIIFIPKYSYYAAAIITVITELMISLIIFIIFYKTTKFIPKINILFKTLTASLIMALPLYYVLNFTQVQQNIPVLLIEIASSGILYLLLLVPLKAIDIQTLKFNFIKK